MGIFSFTIKDSKTGVTPIFDDEYKINVYGYSDEYVEELVGNATLNF